MSKSKGLSQGPEHAPAGFHLSLRMDRGICEKFVQVWLEKEALECSERYGLGSSSSFRLDSMKPHFEVSLEKGKVCGAG